VLVLTLCGCPERVPNPIRSKNWQCRSLTSSIISSWLRQNREEAEGLVQETYAKALKAFSSFQLGTIFGHDVSHPAQHVLNPRHRTKNYFDCSSFRCVRKARGRTPLEIVQQLCRFCSSVRCSVGASQISSACRATSGKLRGFF